MTKNTKIFGLILVSALFFLVQANFAFSAGEPNCSGREMTLEEYKWFRDHNKTSVSITENDEMGKAVAHLINNTDCKMPVGLETYKMYDTVLNHQTLFDKVFMLVPPHTTSEVKLRANLPDCMTQADAYLGRGWTNPNNIIAWLITQSTGTGYADAAGNFCERPANPLVISCSANPNSVKVGESIVWTANASGGNGDYTYSWSGTGNLSGDTKKVSKSYANPGTKEASVTITAGNRIQTATCSATVTENPIPLTVSCSANPSTISQNGTIVWTASATGGSGNFTYSWSGTDGLSGVAQTASKSYTYSGTKNALVTVISGSETKTANCSATVSENPVPLTVSCSANPSTINQNGTITWNANMSGGLGNYTYSWSGTDGLTGNSQSVSRSYSYIGSKTAIVTVTSGSETRTATCSATVSENYTSSLTVSCSPSSSSVRRYDGIYWNAYPSGGSGGYSYSWSGTDSLYGSGSSVYKNYFNTGTKTANVTVYSNGQSTSANCDLNVYDDYIPQNNYLEGSCSASPYNSRVGANVSWNASAYGSYGNYTYSWSGTDGLYGNGQYVSKSYNTPGYKTATVTIYSNGQSITRTCSTNVSQVLAFAETNKLATLSSVYLSEVPYTGIEDKFQLLAFLSGLIGFSALLAFLFIRRKTQEIPFEQVAIASIVTEDAMTDKFVCDRVYNDKQAFENVEDIAINGKIIISTGAIEAVVKASRMQCIDEKELTQKVIDSCRREKTPDKNEWCVIGEGDVRKII